MFASQLVESKHELRGNVAAFSQIAANPAALQLAERAALANGCSHAVEWAAFPDGKGGWNVAFSKYVGYRGVTPFIYNKYRKTNMTGTDTKRRVEKLGGVSYPIGSGTKHPAVAAVRGVCSAFGKAPKATAKVRVFADEERPATMDVLTAAIGAAALSDDELDVLFAEVKQAA